jgi:DNA processing protein
MQDLASYRSSLTLHLLPDIGRSRFNKLVAHFGSADAALDAPASALDEVDGIGPMAVQSILNWRELADVETEMRLIEEHGVSLTRPEDDDYPANLRRMTPPPPLLYYRGALSPMDEASVAVIGARKMSRYGREAARVITTDLARAGLTIVSGLALGVDSAAHRFALDAEGRTIAVLGNGLSHVYPAQHKQLAEEIVENGAIISEMPMAATPDAGSFPQRNAIIAGLSLGVVVVEAGAKSGTAITIGCALDENRAAYAVPGDITRANSVGTNQMIKDGAKLVTCGRDVLLDLRHELRHLLSQLPDLAEPSPDEPPPLPKELNETERAVYEALELDPLHVDALSEALAGTAIAPGDLMAALLHLEIRGLVRQEPGKRFRRVR